MSAGTAAGCGLFASCSLPMIGSAYEAMSEGCALLLAVAGIWLFLRGGRWLYAGTLFLSAAVMSRTNLILLPVVSISLCFLHPASRSALFQRWPQALIAILIFSALPTIWIARNYTITHRSAILTTVEGETLNGGNNDVVARQLEFWGYWVGPELQGELTKRELARTRTEIEVDDYYHEKAVAWIKVNPMQLPRLWLGKLIRSFVPIPWNPYPTSFVLFGYRAILDILFAASLPRWWKRIDSQYVLIFCSFFAVTLATVIVYWGVFRFAHCFVELLFVPFIGVALSPDRPSRPGSAALGSAEDGAPALLQN